MDSSHIYFVLKSNCSKYVQENIKENAYSN